ncbi:MAG: hypothetical protein Q9207_002799 [Kuettlingeria erythrocarpa]
MPESGMDHDSNGHRTIPTCEDKEIKYTPHSMAMSYKVTAVHFFSSGKPRVDVVDSRSGQEELAGIRKEMDCDAKEVTSRLLITEDLPRATYHLLEHIIGVDPRLLDDHRSNGHGSGFVGQADLDIDKAPQSSTVSIVIPFDLQVGPELFPSGGREQRTEAVETDVRSILNYHQLVNYLRRLSVQSVPGRTPTVVVLLYPPLWDLQSFQGSQHQFHVSEDLRIPQDFHESEKNDVNCTQRRIAFDGDGSWLAIRTLELLKYIINSIGTNHNTQEDLAECISTWLMTNAYASFEASVESSIRSWHGIKAHISDPRSRHIDNKRMCEKLRQFTEIKLHLMDRAADNLGFNTLFNATLDAFCAEHVFQRKYILHQWQRSRQSLQWIQDDIGHLLRSNESGLQIDLMNTQIEESRKAIQQAEVVKRLTALAFVFIPISTVCSAFGMNIEQLSHNLPSVWVFATVALAITVSTLICSTELAGYLLGYAGLGPLGSRDLEGLVAERLPERSRRAAIVWTGRRQHWRKSCRSQASDEPIGR